LDNNTEAEIKENSEVQRTDWYCLIYDGTLVDHTPLPGNGDSSGTYVWHYNKTGW